jgi:hypothetical protein
MLPSGCCVRLVLWAAFRRAFNVCSDPEEEFDMLEPLGLTAELAVQADEVVLVEG